MLLLRTSRGVDPGIPLLRSLGSNAHVWIPGANGVSVASLPSNNYLLSDGSTGYSTVDGVDGLTLDGMGSVGAEKVTNGSAFVDTTGWNSATATLSVVAGALRITNDGGTYGRAYQSFTTVVDKTYQVSFSVTPGTTNCELSVGTALYGSSLFDLTKTLSGSFSGFFKATSTTIYLTLWNTGTTAGQYSDWDNISVKEYTGTHLAQPTTANKPLVRRGMLNLLTYSHDLTNVAWTKYATSSITAPSTVNLPATDDRVFGTITVVSGAPYTAAVVLSGSGTVSFGFGTTTNTLSIVTLTATPTLYVVNHTAGNTSGVLFAAYRNGNTATSVTFGGGGLFKGTWTAAQILAEGGIPTTTTTAASNPTSGKYWWSFDGSNDALALGSVPFEMTDDSVVIVGCRNQGASAVDYMVAIKGANYTNVGSLYFASGRPGAVWFDNSSGSADILHASTLYTPAVITSVKRTNAKQLRVNSVQSGATNNTVMSATTVTNAWIGGGSAIYAGVLDSSYYFDGSISIVIVVKGTLTDAELLLLERFAASVTPGAPVF